jgi:thiol-disulfide isomerase/thioredoxin
MQVRSLSKDVAGLLLGSLITWSLGCDRGLHPGQIGRPAPVFAVSDGLQSVDLARLRGHVVVLNFWATWCAPCIEELPSLEALQRQMPQVQIVSIASDETFTEYQSYLQRRPVHLLTVFDDKQASNALYGSFRYPETYVIDRQGIVRRKLIGPQDFTSPEIVNQLKQLASE